MAYVEWNDNYSVNNAEIDAQHRGLLEIINLLHKSLTLRDRDKMLAHSQNALDSFRKYAEQHFAFEEDHMRQINYPDVDRHQEIHRAFFNEIMRHSQEIEAGKIINIDLITSLVSWLHDHVMFEDHKYSEFTAEKTA